MSDTAEAPPALAGTWSFARPDWRDRIRAGQSLMPDLPLLDRKRADKARRIYNRLRVPDVPGQPTFAEAGGEWFRELVGAVHGSIDETGKRQVESFLCMVPKKNTKTTGGAALMMTEVLLNERPREGFTLIGPTQKIAETAYRQAEGMLDADPELAKRFRVQPHLKRLTYLPTKARLEVKSFKPNIVTGINGSTLVDELHLLGEMGEADRCIGQLRGALMARPQAFLGFITTQSERPPAGVFAAELKKARAIRDGKASGAMLPLLYEFPEDLVAAVPYGVIPVWHETSLWHMVTPNAGRSVTIERLASDFREAQLAGEAEVRRWASQHLNIEVGLALRSDRWEGADYWEAAEARGLALDDLLERCEVAVIGIDGGGLDDLLGLAVLGRERGTRRWLLWTHAWAHKDVLERRKSEAPKLLEFQRLGTLTVYEDIGDDVVAVADIVERVGDAGLLPKANAIGVDPVGISEIVDELSVRGFKEGEDQAIVGISQGWRLSNAIKTTARRVAGGELIHGGQPMMAWCVGNAKVEARGNAVTITKQTAGKAKIDPLMAVFDAVALMSLNPTASSGSYLESEGLLVL